MDTVDYIGSTVNCTSGNIRDITMLIAIYSLNAHKLLLENHGL